MEERKCDIYTESNELCETCRNIAKASVGEKIQFGDLDDIQKRLPCKLCHVISVAAQNHRGNRPFESPDRRHERLLLVPRSQTSPGRGSPACSSICSSSLRIESSYSTNPSKPISIVHHTHSGCARFHAADDCPGLLQDLLDRVKRGVEYHEQGDLLDIQTIRSWLRTCENEHDGCNTSSTGAVGSSTRLLVIDVESMCLVEAVSPRYLALSYVWGASQVFKTLKSNLKALMEPGALGRLARDVPVLIQDAVLFTQQLGEKYLWVDSLCIVQDDESTKVELIRRMDTIYAEATCAIIAHGSSDASSPLPGLRHNTRLPYRVTASTRLADGNEELLICSPCHYTTYPSVYDSRAWTFQEQLLSRRRLVFSADQVFFSCNWGAEGDRGEDPFTDMGYSAAHLGVTRIRDASGAPIAILPNLNPDLTGMTDVWKTQQALLSIGRLASNHGVESGSSISMKDVIYMYTAAVTSYSSRQLSFPSDILNAFSGILSTIDRSCGLKPASSLYGLLEMYPIYSLHWIAKTAARRQGWPSWSWVGWDSTIYFLEREDPTQLEHQTGKAYIFSHGEARGIRTSDETRHGGPQQPHSTAGNTILAVFPSPSDPPAAASSGRSSDVSEIPGDHRNHLLENSVVRPALGFWAHVAPLGTLRIRYHPIRQTKVRIWTADNDQCGHVHEEFDWSSATHRPTDEEWDRCQLVYLSHSKRRCVFHIYADCDCAGTCNALVVDPGEAALEDGCVSRVGMAEVCGNTWRDVATTWQFVALT